MKVLRIKNFAIKLGKFLTFYVGNDHHNAKCYQVKKAIQEATCLKTLLIVIKR